MARRDPERRREQSREAGRRYREKNRETINAKQRATYAANPEARAANAAYMVQYRADHPGYATAANLRHKFGLSPEDYEKMHANQGGVCAACGEPETARDRYGVVKKLAVDHDRACCPGDRSCGKCVRALLCQRCNHTIGYAGDDPALLRRIADWLASSAKENPS